MSLQLAAKNLAAKGRNGDSMLVHMSPEEVGGLQALALAKGGSLTINPDTGLPEAFKLKQLLPMIAGLALGPAGFGLFSSALGAGLAVGGVETLRTGDLGKGLMAGLGAYGGAGLGQGLMNAGAGNLPNAAVPLGEQGLTTFTPPPTTGAERLASVGRGVTNLAEPGGFSNLASGLGDAFPSSTGKAAATLGLAAPFIPPPPMPAMPEPEKSNYAGPYKPTEREVRFKDPSDKSSSEFRYFDPFNPIPGFEPLRAADGGSIYSADPNMNYDEWFAVGGLTALAGGRFLQGPGDGTSDSIPAMIGTKQPARLADGEFVIDARTVSELGNGSSKAGAQKLYKMMDRVHAARKKAGRGKDSNADRYMPA